MKKGQSIFAALFAVTLFSGVIRGQTPSVAQYFSQLAAGSRSPAAFDQMMGVTDQILTLSKTEVEAALPSIFAALKFDNDAGIHAAFALTVVSQRPDSGELLQSYLPAIAALLNRPDPRVKATANVVFQRMTPAPSLSFLVPTLSAYVLDAKDSSEAKVAPVMTLARLAPDAPETERSIVYLLGGNLDVKTRIAALNAAASGQVKSAKVVAAVAHDLTSPDEHIELAAIQAISRMGLGAIMQARSALLQLTTDASKSDTVKRLASNAANGADEKCRTLYGKAAVVCN